MLLNLALLILFIIILISDTNTIEGQSRDQKPNKSSWQSLRGSVNETFFGKSTPATTATTAPTTAPTTGTTPAPEETNNSLFSVLNFFPRLFKNELVVYEEKHNDTRNEVYLSSLFDSKGLYNDSEEELKVVNQSNMTAECVDSPAKINDPFITKMHHKYKGNVVEDENTSRSPKNLNLNLLGVDLNFNLDDTPKENKDNPDDVGEEKHSVCELPSILYDKNASMTDRIQINASYGNCFNVKSEMYLTCRKSCYDETSSRTEGSSRTPYCSGSLVGTQDTPGHDYTCDDAMKGKNISDIFKNNYYITYSNGGNGHLSMQCIAAGVNNPDSVTNKDKLHDSIRYDEVACKSGGCQGDLGDCNEINNMTGDFRRFACENTYSKNGEHYLQCIMQGEQCTEQVEGSMTTCTPEHLHTDKDYNMCYKESYKSIKKNINDTDYIVTLF